MIVIKICNKSDSPPNTGSLLMGKIRQKLIYEGIVVNLEEFDRKYMSMELVSAMEDHFPGKYLNPGNPELFGMKSDDNIRRVIGNKSLLDSTPLTIFEYLGNSRIDGNPIFKLSDDGIAKHRNQILGDLGI